MCVCVSVYLLCMYVWVYVSKKLSMYACMYVCMHVCMHACMYACMHACLHVCMYVCIYIYTYVYIYIHGTGLQPHPTVMVMVPVLVMDCSPRPPCGNGGVSWSRSIFVSMYLCSYVCMYVCTYVRTYVCMYVGTLFLRGFPPLPGDFFFPAKFSQTGVPGKQGSKQASKPASKQASKGASQQSKQASKQASKPTNQPTKQASKGASKGASEQTIFLRGISVRTEVVTSYWLYTPISIYTYALYLLALMERKKGIL